jgi:hypothetical protein
MPAYCNICAVDFYVLLRIREIFNNCVTISENEVELKEMHVGIRYKVHEIRLHLSGLSEVTF